MATTAQVQAFIAEAISLGLTPQQIVVMCDRAMADLLIRGQASYQVAGRELNFHNLETVRGVREYFQNEARASAAPMAMLEAEL